MALMDEFKEERETIKDAPFKKRMEYFWEYYKWWVIGGVFAIIVIVMTVRSIVTHKNDVLYVAMINCVEVAGSDAEGSIKEPFLTAHDFDYKKNNILFDIDLKMNFSSIAHKEANEIPEGYTDYVSITNSSNSRQTLSVYIAAGTVDLMVSSENWFDEYAYGGFYLPLNEVLTAQELEQYGDKLYYIDQAVRDRYEKASDEMNYDYNEKYPDPYDIEAMEQPVAYGIIVDGDTRLISNYAFVTESKGDNVVIGFIANGKNVELAHDLLIYLLEETATEAVTE